MNATEVDILEKQVEHLRGEIRSLTGQVDYHRRKWREYEDKYVLPVFKWAEELDFDLQKAVTDNVGKNCVVLFFEFMRNRILPDPDSFVRVSGMMECEHCGRMASEHLGLTILCEGRWVKL